MSVLTAYVNNVRMSTTLAYIQQKIDEKICTVAHSMLHLVYVMFILRYNNTIILIFVVMVKVNLQGGARR